MQITTYLETTASFISKVLDEPGDVLMVIQV